MKLKIFLIILLLGPILTAIFVFDCWQDHVTPLKEVGEPFQQNVLAFYEKNQRRPSFDEIESLIKLSGCSDVKIIETQNFKDVKGKVFFVRKTYNCLAKSMNTSIQISMNLNQQSFEVTQRFGYGRCDILFNNAGKSNFFKCSQNTCILPNFRLDH